MYTKLEGLLCVTLVLLIAGVSAGNTFTDDGADHLWNNTDNWSDGVPVKGGSGEWANMTLDGTLCVIDSTVTDANASGVYPGCYGGDSDMHMSGGYLEVQHLNIGRGEPGSGSKGYLKMTGGVIDAEGLAIPNQFSGTGAPVEGQVDLFGGTINVSGYFGIGGDGGTGRMNITDGTLIVNGDSEAEIQAYIDNGWITAYSGISSFELDYNVRNSGKTTLTATNPYGAKNPNPADSATNISLDSILSWTPGLDSDSHDVYFGTVSPPPSIGNQSGTSYDPCGLEAGTTYYWRVDEVGAGGTEQGPVWKFTTGYPPEAAGIFEPEKGETDVLGTATLRWVPGSGTTSHDVYLGTNFENVSSADDTYTFPGRGNLRV